MITLQQDLDDHSFGCNEWHIDQLVRAATLGMEKATIPDLTTPSEILSATFEMLERTLRAVRKLEAPNDRAYNARQVHKILDEMMIDFGQVPS